MRHATPTAIRARSKQPLRSLRSEAKRLNVNPATLSKAVHNGHKCAGLDVVSRARFDPESGKCVGFVPGTEEEYATAYRNGPPPQPVTKAALDSKARTTAEIAAETAAEDDEFEDDELDDEFEGFEDDELEPYDEDDEFEDDDEEEPDEFEDDEFEDDDEEPAPFRPAAVRPAAPRPVRGLPPVPPARRPVDVGSLDELVEARFNERLDELVDARLDELIADRLEDLQSDLTMEVEDREDGAVIRLVPRHKLPAGVVPWVDPADVGEGSDEDGAVGAAETGADEDAEDAEGETGGSDGFTTALLVGLGALGIVKAGEHVRRQNAV